MIHGTSVSECDAVVRRIAARYKRRCWWAPIDDLRQIGWVAILECARSYDPRVGVPFLGYASRAAVLKMHEALWKASAPCSAGRGRGSLDKLAGKVRAPIEAIDHDTSAVPDPTDAMAQLEWTDRFERAEESATHDMEHRFRAMSACVLFDEVPPRMVAKAFQCKADDVYFAVACARARYRGSAALFDLMKELPR